MQRILQKHIGHGEFVNDAEIASFTPEVREPMAYDGLVGFFLGCGERTRSLAKP
jgi:hypothetical protein